MTPDKNQSGTPQKDQNTTEQVSNPNKTQYRPDWIIPDSDTHSSKRNDDQQNSQYDSASSSTGSDETLGIP